MTISELQSQYPYIEWLSYLNSIMPSNVQFTNSDRIINAVPAFFERLANVLETTNREVMANYLMWRVAFSSASYLPKAFRDRRQEYLRITTGREVETPRGIQCVDVTLGRYPHAFGALYVRKHFNEEAKNKVNDMVTDLFAAFKDILNEVDWMDENTKQKAFEKADKMKSQMAYADELLDDQKLVEYYNRFPQAIIDENQYFESVMQLDKSSTFYNLGLLREPIDKDDWANYVTPAIVNAFYSSLENTIKFPAGILQGAFFNADRPNYMNYGGIGFVIGHEITHG
jgi:neprilysin